jgi:hypothetical protein
MREAGGEEGDEFLSAPYPDFGYVAKEQRGSAKCGFCGEQILQGEVVFLLPGVLFCCSSLVLSNNHGGISRRLIQLLRANMRQPLSKGRWIGQ